MNELLGVGKHTQRTPPQVAALLSRRVDYVQRNVETAQKQLDEAELKLASTEIMSMPKVHDEEGLRMTEILEELDESDNVICKLLALTRRYVLLSIVQPVNFPVQVKRVSR